MLSVDDIKIISNISNYQSSKNNNLSTIVNTTANTWQQGRTQSEKKSDTELGKLAEEIVENYIEKNLTNCLYYSYDDFRTNNFAKHAPFDGILYHKDSNKDNIKDFIAEINEEVTRGDTYAKISNQLKNELLKHKIYTIEIKSTRINKRHKINGNVDLSSILKDDFLTYPKYLRSVSSSQDYSINDYIQYCKQKNYFTCTNSGEECEKMLRQIEKDNMQHIYVRVYIDAVDNFGYIIGCISNKRFSETACIKKMPKYDKSENALYLATNLKDGYNIDLLNNIKPHANPRIQP